MGRVLDRQIANECEFLTGLLVKMGGEVSGNYIPSLEYLGELRTVVGTHVDYLMLDREARERED